MKISVAIPCYNGAAYVGRAIEALLAQSRSADEIIVVDDGSFDNSAAIVRQYPVRLISQKNGGLSAARNAAIAVASGDVLVFVDVDAFAAPNLVEVLLAGYMGDDLQLAGVGGRGIESNIRSLADRWRRAHASQGYGTRRKYVPYLCGLCMSFRVAVLRQAGGFNETFRTNADDMDIGLRLTRAGFRLLYLPEAQVFHQRSDGAASLKRTMAAWYSAAYLAKWMNHADPWTLFFGTLRRLIMDPLRDLFVLRDPSLVRLSLTISWLKLNALWQTAQSCRNLRRPAPD